MREVDADNLWTSRCEMGLAFVGSSYHKAFFDTTALHTWSETWLVTAFPFLILSSAPAAPVRSTPTRPSWAPRPHSANRRPAT